MGRVPWVPAWLLLRAHPRRCRCSSLAGSMAETMAACPHPAACHLRDCLAPIHTCLMPRDSIHCLPPPLLAQDGLARCFFQLSDCCTSLVNATGCPPIFPLS